MKAFFTPDNREYKAKDGLFELREGSRHHQEAHIFEEGKPDELLGTIVLDCPVVDDFVCLVNEHEVDLMLEEAEIWFCEDRDPAVNLVSFEDLVELVSQNIITCQNQELLHAVISPEGLHNQEDDECLPLART